jgi:uncharacterized protein YkwD
MKQPSLLLARLCLLLLLVAVFYPLPSQAMPRMSEPTDTAVAFSWRVVELTNIERARLNLPPLRANAHLGTAAMWLAGDMALKDYFSHTDSQGRAFSQRLIEFGYPYNLVGENIAAGQGTAEEVVHAWLHHEGHRENMLNPGYREMGAGYFYLDTATYYHYWVQDFGRQDDVYPVIINCEATTTDDAQATLYIYGEGWAQEMRLSNDGVTWTDWRPFQPLLYWQLAEGHPGVRTVFVELRQGSTVRRVNDSIDLTVSNITDSQEPPRGQYNVMLPYIKLRMPAPQQSQPESFCPQLEVGQ